MLQSLRRCVPGVSKGGGSRAGAAGVQRPFGLLLLVLFLQEQEKNEENDDKINDHLSYQVSLILLHFFSLCKSAFLSKTVVQKKLDSGEIICYNMEIMNRRGVDFP